MNNEDLRKMIDESHATQKQIRKVAESLMVIFYILEKLNITSDELLEEAESYAVKITEEQMVKNIEEYRQTNKEELELAEKFEKIFGKKNNKG